jgi:alpha-tubulin suppressor-like RCC1 family protein
MKPLRLLTLLSAACLAAPAALAATLNALYNSPADVPVTTNSYTAAGNTLNVTLNFAPATGTALTVVNNTGLSFINGTFDNLANGQALTLSYGATSYQFVANYYGGSGNDLVLVWANNQAFAWGGNSNGQLGDNSTTSRQLPVPVTATGVLAGKTLLAVAAGNGHSLALCSDGTLAAWGNNRNGQLGNNSTTNSSLPVVVNTDTNSALHGKTVVAIAAGFDHSIALCADGTVAGWGWNGYGQLGDTTFTERHVPVAVNAATNSALYGKSPVAIAAGFAHSLALCSDGTVVAWGYNASGQLGNNTNTSSPVPVAVNTDTNSALQGRTVAAITAGGTHSVALCSDGTIAAWGGNKYGQLGNGTTNSSLVPVAVDAGANSALEGKTAVAIAAGDSHNLALCADGSVAAWGSDLYGQLGSNMTSNSPVPVAVNTASGVSALFGKRALAVAAGDVHSLALCSDGTAAAWGDNSSSQLGDNSSSQRNAPVTVDTAPLAAGQRFTLVTTSSSAFHTLALAATPPPSQILLTGARTLPDGSFQFLFTGAPGGSFSAFTTTNLSVPFSNWTFLGTVTDNPPGHFQFTDGQAPLSAHRFYRVRSP